MLPLDKFVGIAIEGFSPSDQVSKDATEIADSVLYYGREASFEHSTRVVVVQDMVNSFAEKCSTGWQFAPRHVKVATND